MIILIVCSGYLRAESTSVLKIESNVKDADVLLNGTFRGRTDIVLENLKPGKYSIIVKKDGYKSYERTITLKPGRKLSLQVYFEHKSIQQQGSLYIDTNPSQATIRFVDSAQPFIQGMDLKEGNHQITISKPGYEDKTLKVYISPGEDMNIAVNLTKNINTSAPEMSIPIITNSLGMEFVKMNHGRFLMGSPKGEKGRNSKGEEQSMTGIWTDFYLQTTEVTQKQWMEIMGNNPSLFKNCGDTCPVEQVSYKVVQQFIKKLNQAGEGSYRLPTDEEWEFAARAGSTSAYSFGNDAYLLGEYAWYIENSGKKTHPVSEKKPNSWGLYDMHGNVQEWTDSTYRRNFLNARKGNKKSRESSKKETRIIKGGHYAAKSTVLRSAYATFYPIKSSQGIWKMHSVSHVSGYNVYNFKINSGPRGITGFRLVKIN